MGKGDKKTRRGKIQIGSFGKRRPRKKAEAAKVAVVTEKKAAPKKAAKKATK